MPVNFAVVVLNQPVDQIAFGVVAPLVIEARVDFAVAATLPHHGRAPVRTAIDEPVEASIAAAVQDYGRGSNIGREKIARLAVYPWRKFFPPTGPISP